MGILKFISVLSLVMISACGVKNGSGQFNGFWVQEQWMETNGNSSTDWTPVDEPSAKLLQIQDATFLEADLNQGVKTCQSNQLAIAGNNLTVPVSGACPARIDYRISFSQGFSSKIQVQLPMGAVTEVRLYHSVDQSKFSSLLQNRGISYP